VTCQAQHPLLLLQAATEPATSQASLAYQELAEGVTPAEAICFVMLAVSTVGTAAFTCRFLLSCFPQLERKRKEQPWAALTASTDPVLEPLRTVFAQNIRKLDGMDVSSVAALGILCILQEASFGPDGLLLKYIPYATVQDMAEMLLITQKVFALPMWLLLVFRWISYI